MFKRRTGCWHCCKLAKSCVPNEKKLLVHIHKCERGKSYQTWTTAPVFEKNEKKTQIARTGKLTWRNARPKPGKCRRRHFRARKASDKWTKILCVPRRKACKLWGTKRKNLRGCSALLTQARHFWTVWLHLDLGFCDGHLHASRDRYAKKSIGAAVIRNQNYEHERKVLFPINTLTKKQNTLFSIHWGNEEPKI